MTSGSGEVAASSWVNDLGVADAMADGVVVLAPGGAIAWANEAFARLVGRPLDRLAGRNGLDLVHPDELVRAADGMLYAQQFPGRTSVAPYRVQRGDGSWIDIELKSGVITRPDGDHLVLVVRDGTARQGIARALRSVASGSTFEHTAMLTCDVITDRWPNTGAAVSYGTPEGRRVIGTGLGEALMAHALGSLPAALALWELCPVPGTVVTAGPDELPPALAAAAGREGFEGCGVALVADPAGDPCCLVVWFDHAIIGRLEFRHAAWELTELLTLALERRHHAWQLAHLARHDALTGVLNRAGFFDRIGEELSQVDAHDDGVVALLYVDLDDLKVVNDGQGHAAGDELLVEVGRRLTAVAGSADAVARIGGDEFVIIERIGTGDARRRAEHRAMAVLDALGRGETPIGACVGVAIGDGQLSGDALLDEADAAMYRAKSAGKGCWSF